MWEFRAKWEAAWFREKCIGTRSFTVLWYIGIQWEWSGIPVFDRYKHNEVICLFRALEEGISASFSVATENLV
jgi:hypothetical protein